MPFAYFSRLSRARQRVYLRSAAVTAVPLPDAAALAPLAAATERALAAGERQGVEEASQALADGLCRQLAVPAVAVSVLAARQSHSWGELHGLYEPEPPPARITLWMRTAERRQVVAPRTFLRTLFHELLHHLDYEWLKLPETFHTEGFFQRESDLARQLLPPSASLRARRPSEPTR